MSGSVPEVVYALLGWNGICVLCEKCGHEHADARQADNGSYYGFEVSFEVPGKYLTPLQRRCTHSRLCTLRPLENVRAGGFWDLHTCSNLWDTNPHSGLVKCYKRSVFVCVFVNLCIWFKVKRQCCFKKAILMENANKIILRRIYGARDCIGICLHFITTAKVFH